MKMPRLASKCVCILLAHSLMVFNPLLGKTPIDPIVDSTNAPRDVQTAKACRQVTCRHSVWIVSQQCMERTWDTGSTGRNMVPDAWECSLPAGLFNLKCVRFNEWWRMLIHGYCIQRTIKWIQMVEKTFISFQSIPTSLAILSWRLGSFEDGDLLAQSHSSWLTLVNVQQHYVSMSFHVPRGYAQPT